MTTPTVQPSIAAVAAREALESGDPFAVMRRYRRATNFLAAAQVYLKSNALLRDPLTSDDIKPRLLGHWGAAPAINLVYAHLDRLVNERQARVLLVTGPGHGAAANLANHYLDGSLEEFYPDMTRDAAGIERFVRSFSWPGGFPSHLTPGTPGTIHEGGELGYALATVVRGGDGQPGPARRVHRRRRRGRDRADGRLVEQQPLPRPADRRRRPPDPRRQRLQDQLGHDRRDDERRRAAHALPRLRLDAAPRLGRRRRRRRSDGRRARRGLGADRPDPGPGPLGHARS